MNPCVSFGGARPARPPAFAGKRRPDAKYAIEWVKKRLRAIHREARAAGKPSPLTEPAAHLYLLLGSELLDNRFVTEPLVLQEFLPVMHCEAVTVRRARQLLEELGEIRMVKGGQGAKDVRFAFVRMGGPLLVEALASGDLTSILESEVSPNLDLKDRSHFDLKDRSDGSPRSLRSKLAAGDYVPSVEEEGSTSTGEEAAAFALLDWWRETYPDYHAGALAGLELEADRRLIEQLLAEGRTPEQVKAMAVAMWTTSADDDQNSDASWTARGDQSIRWLHRKRQWLGLEVVRRRGAEPSAPTECAAVWDAILERLHARGVKAFNVATYVSRPCRLVEVNDTTVTIQVREADRLAIAAMQLEHPLAAAVNDVLGPRRLEFTGRADALASTA